MIRPCSPSSDVDPRGQSTVTGRRRARYMRELLRKSVYMAHGATIKRGGGGGGYKCLLLIKAVFVPHVRALTALSRASLSLVCTDPCEQ